MLPIFKKDFNQVWVLTFSSALAGSAMTMMMLVGSLVGRELAPSNDWATLPIATIVIGTAMSILPATRLMKLLGRKTTFYIFLGIGLLACALGVLSLELSNFFLFCGAAFLLGSCAAALQQIRFAAMEMVAFDAAATAASMVMCGGILAAVLGPELALWGSQLTEVRYQGSFLLAALSFLSAAVLLFFYRPAVVVAEDVSTKARPVSALFRNPTFCLALASGVVSYVVMSFVMTGTPISMHHMHGHSLADTKWVIQSHIAAMFLPSLIAPYLYRLFGIRSMMVLGLLCYCAIIPLAYLDTSVNGFWMQLVLLGIGWNFLFVSGTSLLPTTYAHEDRFQAQAVNDVTIFSIQAAASLSAGWALSLVSWQVMVVVCLLPILLMVGVLVWERSRGQVSSGIKLG
jgi:MFS family permease